MKRFLALLTVLFLLVPTFTAYGHKEPSRESLEQTIIDACTYNQPADLSPWSITAPALEELFFDMRYGGKLPWYANIYSYTCSQDTENVINFTPKNRDPEIYDRVLYEQKITELIDEVVLDGMTPVQIALAVHDRLVVMCTYDTTLEANTGYDLLINGTTVCAGYSALYMDILLRVGIPCVTVSSKEMNHAWNLVQLDGDWYHVDVTWDDPNPNTMGKVRHTYFLVTDEEITSGDDPHYGWKTDITCANTRFADAYWREVRGAVCFSDSDTAFLIRKNDQGYHVIRRTESTGEETVLYSESKHYVHTGEKRYGYGHDGLSLVGDRLYFGVQDAILSVSIQGGRAQTEYSYDTRTNRKYICGVSVAGNIASITLSDHDSNKEDTTATLDIPLPDGHTHSYTSTVTDPTCTDPGYTTWTCQCTLACRGLPTAPAGHTMITLREKKATFFGDGLLDEQCSICGVTQSTVLEQIIFLQWAEENKGSLVFYTLLVWITLRLINPKKQKPKKQLPL